MGRLRTVPQQEPLPHYPWLVTCLSQKSFPMYTRICNIGTPSKRSPSTQVLKELVMWCWSKHYHFIQMV